MEGNQMKLMQNINRNKITSKLGSFFIIKKIDNFRFLVNVCITFFRTVIVKLEIQNKNFSI